MLVTVYDRLDSLTNAIYSLKQNSLAKHTPLFIVSDAPYKDSHKSIIREVRRYITNIDGFKSVEGIFWDSNKGSFDSCRDATEYIFQRYDRIITLEDDILVSNKFLEYLNNALRFYENDKRIMSIAAHTHCKQIIPNDYPYDVYLAQMYSPWGSAIWKDRYKSIDFSLSGIYEFLQNKAELAQFNAISRHMLPILNDMLSKGKKYGDVMICYNMFKNSISSNDYRFTLYPIKPLAVNRGFDGRGEHCGYDNEWQTQELVNDFCPKMAENLDFYPEVKKNLYKAFYSYKRDIMEPVLKKVGLYDHIRYAYKKMKARV